MHPARNCSSIEVGEGRAIEELSGALCLANYCRQEILDFTAGGYPEHPFLITSNLRLHFFLLFTFLLFKIVSIFRIYIILLLLLLLLLSLLLLLLLLLIVFLFFLTQ